MREDLAQLEALNEYQLRLKQKEKQIEQHLIKKKAKAFYKVAWSEQVKRFKLKELEKASLKVDEAYD